MKRESCANPCAKGKAGACSGACTIDFLGFQAGARTLSAKVGKKPTQPNSGHTPAKED